MVYGLLAVLVIKDIDFGHFGPGERTGVCTLVLNWVCTLSSLSITSLTKAPRKLTSRQPCTCHNGLSHAAGKRRAPGQILNRVSRSFAHVINGVAKIADYGLKKGKGFGKQDAHPTKCRDGSRIFSGGVHHYFNTNKPHIFIFCGTPVVLEGRRSSQGGVRTPCTLPLDPPLAGKTPFPRSGIIFETKSYRYQ